MKRSSNQGYERIKHELRRHAYHMHTMVDEFRQLLSGTDELKRLKFVFEVCIKYEYVRVYIYIYIFYINVH